MAITAWGSGGGGGLVLSPHTVDVNTVEHWELTDNFVADNDPVNHNFDAGTFVPGYLPGSSSKTCYVCPPTPAATARGAASAALQLTNTYTIAACVYNPGYPGGAQNQVLWRFAPWDQGSDIEANNTLYDLAMNPLTGVLRVFWENGAGVNNTDTLALTLPEYQWSYVAMVVNADGLGGTVYVNDSSEAFTMSNAATGGTSGELNLGNGNQGDPTRFSFYSLIIKDIAATSGQVAALRASVGL
jgi:hypothetical protein